MTPTQPGLLWYDSDPTRSLADKVTQAAGRFQKKFGAWPATCLVHPSSLPEGVEVAVALGTEADVPQVRVAPVPYVQRSHFLLLPGNGSRFGGNGWNYCQ